MLHTFIKVINECKDLETKKKLKSMISMFKFVTYVDMSGEMSREDVNTELLKQLKKQIKMSEFKSVDTLDGGKTKKGKIYEITVVKN